MTVRSLLFPSCSSEQLHARDFKVCLACRRLVRYPYSRSVIQKLPKFNLDQVASDPHGLQQALTAERRFFTREATLGEWSQVKVVQVL